MENSVNNLFILFLSYCWTTTDRARTLHGPGFDSYGMARSVSLTPSTGQCFKEKDNSDKDNLNLYL